jgi:hypothetical protein
MIATVPFLLSAGFFRLVMRYPLVLSTTKRLSILRLTAESIALLRHSDSHGW